MTGKEVVILSLPGVFLLLAVAGLEAHSMRDVLKEAGQNRKETVYR